MTDNNLFLYILFSIVIMLVFAMAVIWFLNQTQRKITEGKLKEQQRELDFQKEMLLNTVKTQEGERERISKELHDDVTSQLSIVHLNLHLLKQKMNSNPELTSIFEHIEYSLKNSTERTRTISHELMPAILLKFGFHNALKELANGVNLTETFEVNIIDDEKIKIKDEFKLLHIYRVIQELLNNTLKYAKAKKVDITFDTIGDELIMTYQDDGVGFDTNKLSEGLGLGNIKTRIRLLDGDINWDSTPSEGVTVLSKFPNYDKT